MRVTNGTSVFSTKRMLQQKLQPTKSVFGNIYEDKEHWMPSVQTVTRLQVAALSTSSSSSLPNTSS